MTDSSSSLPMDSLLSVLQQAVATLQAEANHHQSSAAQSTATAGGMQATGQGAGVTSTRCSRGDGSTDQRRAEGQNAGVAAVPRPSCSRAGGTARQAAGQGASAPSCSSSTQGR